MVALQCLLLFGILIVPAMSQLKGGDCPPALPVGVCYPSCSGDGECGGFYKCCPTSCGGTVCSRPVTTRRMATMKSGVCPDVPSGPWVCSDRCSTDADCRGRNKCCRNRCGALACLPPQLF